MILEIIAIVCLTTAIVGATVLIDYERAVKGKNRSSGRKGGNER